MRGHRHSMRLHFFELQPRFWGVELRPRLKHAAIGPAHISFFFFLILFLTMATFKNTALGMIKTLFSQALSSHRQRSNDSHPPQTLILPQLPSSSFPNSDRFINLLTATTKAHAPSPTHFLRSSKQHRRVLNHRVDSSSPPFSLFPSNFNFKFSIARSGSQGFVFIHE